MKARHVLIVVTALSALTLIGCKQSADVKSPEITAKNRIETNSQVEADAAKAKINQKSPKDGSEMIDSIHKADSEVAATNTFISNDGSSIVATYFNNGTVRLVFSDNSTKILSQAVSGSGIRYISDGAEWLEHQGEAIYYVNDKEVFVGKLKE